MLKIDIKLINCFYIAYIKLLIYEFVQVIVPSIEQFGRDRARSETRKLQQSQSLATQISTLLNWTETFRVIRHAFTLMKA